MNESIFKQTATDVFTTTKKWITIKFNITTMEITIIVFGIITIVIPLKSILDILKKHNPEKLVELAIKENQV